MRWPQWLVVALIFVNAGWMTFDGVRALATGDYVTPKSGPRAGQLGPWSKVVAAVGLEPRSNVTKLLFISYGLVALAMLVCFTLRLPWAWTALLITAAAGLWYVPVGTLLNLVAIGLLIAFKPQVTSP
jgi:hypothetical protein